MLNKCSIDFDSLAVYNKIMLEYDITEERMHMSISDVIKYYRKKNGMTQEEMARRLGVTTPAVNKWERGNTLPDISLLAPIARLLGIKTDELLAYHDELTETEINQYLQQLREDLENKEYSEVFSSVKAKIEEYPNCEELIWHAAMLLQTRLLFTEGLNAKEYEPMIYGWFEQCLLSENEQIRKRGAEALFYAYFNEEDYEKASLYLTYISMDDPERKRKEAMIYSKTGKKEDAYCTYEEMLLNSYQSIQLTLNNLRILYMEDNNHEMVKKLVDVSAQAASAFDMGRYNEISVGLDVAAWEQDVDWTIRIMQELLKCVSSIGDFTKSSLYQHMPLKDIPEEFQKRILNDLFAIFEDERFTYMEGNEYWERLRKDHMD